MLNSETDWDREQRNAIPQWLWGFVDTEYEDRLRRSDSKTRNLVGEVARRVLFVDYLRYRSFFFAPSFRFPPAHFIGSDYHEQVTRLRVFLLCTCIDALGQTQDYLQFHEWLKPTRADECRDKRINRLLSGKGPPRTGADFLELAHEAWDGVYRPHYSVRQAFHRFFDSGIPDALQQVLADVYLVSQVSKTDPTLDFEFLDKSRGCWARLSLRTKLKRIADYYYNRARNPYAHSLTSVQPHLGTRRPFGLSESEPYDPWLHLSTEDTIKDQRGFSVRSIRGKAGEDEVLTLRFIVAFGALHRLGFRADAAAIELFREKQLRRHRIYHAIWELQQVGELLQHCESDVGCFEYPTLAILPTAAVSRLVDDLVDGTRHARGLHDHLRRYLLVLQPIQDEIGRFNEASASCFGQTHHSPSDHEACSQAKQETLLKIRSMPQVSDARRLARLISAWLDSDVDRADW